MSGNGKILGPNPNATPDLALALESEKKFASLDISKVICYHGRLCDENVNQQFRERASNR